MLFAHNYGINSPGLLSSTVQIRLIRLLIFVGVFVGSETGHAIKACNINRLYGIFYPLEDANEIKRLHIHLGLEPIWLQGSGYKMPRSVPDCGAFHF